MKYRPFLDLTPGGSSTANPGAGRAGSRFSSNILIIAIEEARCLAWFRLLGATLHGLLRSTSCAVTGLSHRCTLSVFKRCTHHRYRRIYLGITITKIVLSCGSFMT
jgi:hypothetical protein